MARDPTYALVSTLRRAGGPWQAASLFFKHGADDALWLLWCHRMELADASGGPLPPPYSAARCGTPVARAPSFSRVGALPAGLARCPVCAGVQREAEQMYPVSLQVHPPAPARARARARAVVREQ